MNLKPHPAADLFPMLPQADLETMAADIKANGQAVPIAILNAAFIIDGRNRYAACKLAGVEPKTREMQSEFSDEAEVIRFIISTNIHRRHLTESQRAMIASELAKLGDGQRPGASIEAPAMTQDQAASAMQVSRASVQRAREVQEKAPDLVAQVKSGEIKVSKAASMARERQRQSAPVTNPDNADDAVVEKKIETAAAGYTPKMEKVWAGYAALDAVEQTAFRERMGA